MPKQHVIHIGNITIWTRIKGLWQQPPKRIMTCTRTERGASVSLFCLWCLLAGATIVPTNAWLQCIPVVPTGIPTTPTCDRRNFLTALILTTAAAPAQALDMDSFMSQELSAPKSAPSTAKLSDDEALCRFGQPSKERGDACVRAGISTSLKKGGVDAYGNVDRGDFVRCKLKYVDDPNIKGFLMKTTVCE